MKLLDLSLARPEENIALDEVVLEMAEGTESEILRFWESPRYFVVLGAGSPHAKDVNMPECKRLGIPVIRRCSGGGTVVQGKGCLNFCLALDKDKRRELDTIDGTNRYILGKVIEALKEAGVESELKGISDLTVNGVKFSGNAQRRRKRFILFHGTILYDFDLSVISRYLLEPEKQPEYRRLRSHEEFVRNIPVNPEKFKAAFARLWEVEGKVGYWPGERVAALIENKYGKDSWNEMI